MKLTEEQSEMVAKNHSLIYWYAHSSGLNLADWYDLLAIELCYTVMKYDPSKGSIGNYYKLRADGLVYKEYRKSQTQKRLTQEVAFIDNYHNIPDGSDIRLERELLELLEGENGEILKLKMSGYTQTEIARLLGVSQSYVSNALKKMRTIYNESK